MSYHALTIMRPGDVRLAAVFALAVGAACGGNPPPATPGTASQTNDATPHMLHAPGIPEAFSQADVDFMTGMIPHHAQAVIMGGWAPSHGARSDVAILCGRIVVGQTDEIKLMQTWLSDRGQMVPGATSTRMHMVMNGETHDMLMPGMLTDEEMAQLDKARGPEFDRLFLIGMIKHHQGAVDMVDVLFKAYGGAQDTQIYKFASDVYADQSVEIDRMKQMLASGGEPRS
jgi:uncharacterized protein (DUF305 family)